MTALAQLAVAIDSALTSAGIAYHAGIAPPRTAVPYVCSDSDADSSRSYFRNGGTESTLTLHLWAEHKMAALALWQTVYSALHLVSLPVEGFELERGRVRMLGGFIDPPTGRYHAIVEYEAKTTVEATS